MKAIASTADFDALIAGSGEVPVLVDFYADWCGPCRAMMPLVEKMSEKWGEKVQVAKVDVDALPELAEKFGITGIPAFRIFKNGELVNEVNGSVTAPELAEAVGVPLA